MDVELEHGLHDLMTNVTDSDPTVTGKIAQPHLKEFPDYDTRLERMEEEAKRDHAGGRSTPGGWPAFVKDWRVLVRQHTQKGVAAMIGVEVTFQYEADFDPDLPRAVAEAAHAQFEGMPGLRSKAFTIDEDNRQAVNFYLWESEEAARSSSPTSCGSG